LLLTLGAALLGKAPDREVARRTGRSLPDPKVRRWTKADDALLGTMRDEVLAKRLNRPIHAVRFGSNGGKFLSLHRLGHKWTPASDELFRRFSNAEIARRLAGRFRPSKINGFVWTSSRQLADDTVKID
jgi:hypothetical protein